MSDPRPSILRLQPSLGTLFRDPSWLPLGASGLIWVSFGVIGGPFLGALGSLRRPKADIRGGGPTLPQKKFQLVFGVASAGRYIT